MAGLSLPWFFFFFPKSLLPSVDHHQDYIFFFFFLLPKVCKQESRGLKPALQLGQPFQSGEERVWVPVPLQEGGEEDLPEGTLV